MPFLLTLVTIWSLTIVWALVNIWQVALVLLFATALVFGIWALRAAPARRRLLRGGLALACVLCAGTVVWSLRHPGPAPVPAALSVYYLAGGTGSTGIALTSVRARDGVPRWQRPLAASSTYLDIRDCQAGVLTLIGDGSYAAGFGQLIVLRAADGVEMWRMTTLAGAAIQQLHAEGALGDNHQVLQDGDVIYARLIPDAQATIVAALRTSDGQVLWRVRDAHPLDDLVTGNLEATSMLATGDGNLYVAPSPDRVIAYRATDGQEQWERTLDIPSGRYANLEAGPGAVYVVGASGGLSALNARDGSTLWQVALPPVAADQALYTGYTPPLLDGSVLITSVTDNNTGRTYLYAQRSSDGGRAWTRSLATTALFHDGTSIYVYGDGGPILDELRVSDGQTIGQAGMGDIAPMDVADGLVVGGTYISPSGFTGRGPINTLEAIGARNGTRYWTRSLPWLEGAPIEC